MDTIGAEAPEWEYEYDENETEDFYLVVELPLESALKPQSKADDLFAAHDPTQPRKKAIRAGKKRRRNATADDEDEVEDEALAPPVEPSGQEQHSPLPNIQSLNLAATTDELSTVVPSGLQVMDLESDEPVIMYQGQICSCRWASSIGSDLLFVRRQGNADTSYKPLHSFKDVDILGISAAKLIASPATIERRQEFAVQSSLDTPTANTGLDIQNEDVLRQARFLGQIADIKAKRGESVGNLRTLAESVHRNPENFGSDGKTLKRGRGRRGRAARRAKTTATQNVAIIAATRSRSASARRESVSTPTPGSWAELDDAMGEERS